MKIKLDNLTKKFDSFIAVNNINVEFKDGELVCLLGPSGCGKSTILYLVSGILEATDGKIFFDNEDVTNVPPEKRNVGLVFQNYSLYPHMTVEGNIGFPLEIKKVPKKERLEKVNELAKLVHIDSMLKRKPKELSGGQQQRVAIARALAKEPKVLLLDEPLSNLDARLRIEMREEIRKIQQSTKVTAIFVTHDQEEAMTIADRILLVDKGVIQQFSSPQDLYENPANLFVADFLGNPPINKIHCKINNGKLVTADKSAEIVYNDLNDINEEKVILGIRAESLQLTDDDNYNAIAKVKSYYTLGKDKMVELTIGNIVVKSSIPSTINIKEGMEVKLKFVKPGVFIFNPKDGTRIK